MAFTEDLSVFFDTDDFAVTATKEGGGTASVIEDSEFLLAHGMVSTTDPAALAKASDFSASDVGNTLTIGATTWRIRNVEKVPPDGALVVVQLEGT